jgi:hypothetical protein
VMKQIQHSLVLMVLQGRRWLNKLLLCIYHSFDSVWRKLCIYGTMIMGHCTNKKFANINYIVQDQDYVCLYYQASIDGSANSHAHNFFHVWHLKVACYFFSPLCLSPCRCSIENIYPKMERLLSLFFFMECHWTSCFLVFYYAETIVTAVWWPYGWSHSGSYVNSVPEVICLAIKISVMSTCRGMIHDQCMFCLQSWCMVCAGLSRLVRLTARFEQPSIDFESPVVMLP